MVYRLSFFFFLMLSLKAFPLMADSLPSADAKFRVEILKLQDRLIQIASGQNDNRRLGSFILGGYATGITTGWWMGLEGGGPWFFASAVGVAGGVFGAVIPPELARTFYFRRRAIRDFRSLLQSQSSRNLSAESFGVLLDTLFILKNELILKNLFISKREHELLLDLFEAFLDFQYIYAVPNGDDELAQHSVYLNQALENLEMSLDKIEDLSSEHRSFSILQRAIDLKRRLMGLKADRASRRGWEAWKAWVRAESMTSEMAQELVEEERKRSRERLWLSSPLVWQLENEERLPYLIKLVSPPEEAPRWIVSSRFFQIFVNSDLGGSLGALLETLSRKGVWIRWSGLQQSSWEYYASSDQLPFSKKYSLGELEVTSNPYRQSGQNLRLEMKSALRGSDLQALLGRRSHLKSTCKSLAARLGSRSSEIRKNSSL